MKIRILLLAAATAALMLFFVACEEEETITRFSQEDWCIEGWKRWVAADYDGAETAFGNALKEDPYYAKAYGGLGWTYIREHVMEDAVKEFENGILVGEQEGTPLPTRQMIFMGAATAYEAADEYGMSANRGRYMADNLLGEEFNLLDPNITHVTTYDLFIILALDYYGLGDSANTVWAINKMRTALGEQANYQFTSWEAATKEIERLVGLDPS